MHCYDIYISRRVNFFLFCLVLAPDSDDLVRVFVDLDLLRVEPGVFASAPQVFVAGKVTWTQKVGRSSYRKVN